MTSSTTATPKSIAPKIEIAPPFNWRALLDVHPGADEFPLFTEAELKELAEDIKTNGLRAPILGWALGGQFLLDGRNRLDALARLGLLYKTDDGHIGLKKWTGKEWSDRPGGRIEFALEDAGVGFKNFYAGDPYAIALSLNVHRRHLTPKQKHELIVKLLKAKPEASNSSIAKQVKADDKVVDSVRRELEANSDIPNKPDRVEASGRKARGRKPGRQGRGRKPATKPKPIEPLSVATPEISDPEIGETKPVTTGKRTTHADLIEVWRAASPSDRTKAIDAIGLEPLLAAIPPTWLPLFADRLASRPMAAPATFDQRSPRI